MEPNAVVHTVSVRIPIEFVVEIKVSAKDGHQAKARAEAHACGLTKRQVFDMHVRAKVRADLIVAE